MKIPENMTEEIKLGDKVRDVVTGSACTVVVRIKPLDGHAEFGVRGPTSIRDDKLPPIQMLPESYYKRSMAVLRFQYPRDESDLG